MAKLFNHDGGRFDFRSNDASGGNASIPLSRDPQRRILLLLINEFKFRVFNCVKKILLRGGIKIFLIHVKRERIGSIVASLDSSFSAKKMFSRIWMETMYRIPTFSVEGKSCSWWRLDFSHLASFAIFHRGPRKKCLKNETVQPFSIRFSKYREIRKKRTIYPSISSFFKLRPYPRVSQS